MLVRLVQESRSPSNVSMLGRWRNGDTAEKGMGSLLYGWCQTITWRREVRRFGDGGGDCGDVVVVVAVADETSCIVADLSMPGRARNWKVSRLWHRPRRSAIRALLLSAAAPVMMLHSSDGGSERLWMARVNGVGFSFTDSLEPLRETFRSSPRSYV